MFYDVWMLSLFSVALPRDMCLMPCSCDALQFPLFSRLRPGGAYSDILSDVPVISCSMKVLTPGSAPGDVQDKALTALIIPIPKSEGQRCNLPAQSKHTDTLTVTSSAASRPSAVKFFELYCSRAVQPATQIGTCRTTPISQHQPCPPQLRMCYCWHLLLFLYVCTCDFAILESSTKQYLMLNLAVHLHFYDRSKEGSNRQRVIVYI